MHTEPHSLTLALYREAGEGEGEGVWLGVSQVRFGFEGRPGDHMGSPLQRSDVSPSCPIMPRYRDACTGGSRSRQGRASSSVAASWISTCSSAGRAPNWRPIGRPLECQASGREIAGVPATL